MKVETKNGDLRHYHNCVLTYNFKDANTISVKHIGKRWGKTDGVHPIHIRPVAIFRIKEL